MRQGEFFGGTIGLIIVLIVIFANAGGDNSGKADQPTHITQQSEPTSVAHNPVAHEPTSQFASDQSVSEQQSVPEQSNFSSVSDNGASTDSTAGGTGGVFGETYGSDSRAAGDPAAFPYQAVVDDSRGKIVVQGGPSVFYENVEVIRSGTTVRAAKKTGKWISVQLADGKVGYVRQKQLKFQ
jgi:hypothetical protein